MRQETGNFGRIVLQIGVERHHQLAPGLGKTGVERRGLAEVPAKANRG